MAIAYDAVSSGTITAGNLTATFAHTVTGANTIGHVSVGQQNDASGNRVTGVTWNGVAMTLVQTNVNATDDALYMWELINPTTGNIVVTRTGTTNNGFCNAISHTGAKQSAQPDATGFNEAVTNSLGTSVTTAADNSWAVLAAYNPEGSAITASTNSTERSAVVTYAKLFDNNTDITPAGSYSMTVTRSGGSSQFHAVMASFAPATAAGPANVKTINGLALGSVKTRNGLAVASIKSINGLA